MVGGMEWRAPNLGHLEFLFGAVVATPGLS